MNKYNPKIHHRRSIRLKGYDYAQAGLYFITICCQDKACLFGQIENGKMILNEPGKMIKKWYDELENKFSDIKCHEMIVMPNHFHCIIENVGSIAVGSDLRVCPNDNEQMVDDGKRSNENDLIREQMDNGGQLNENDLIREQMDNSGQLNQNDLIHEQMDNGGQLNENDLIREQKNNMEQIDGNEQSDKLGQTDGKPHNIDERNDISVEQMGDDGRNNTLVEHIGNNTLVEHMVDDDQNNTLVERIDNNTLVEHKGSPLPGVVQWFKTMTTNEYIRGVKNLGWKSFNGKLWQRNYYEHIIRNEQAYQNISKYIVNNPAKWYEDKFHK